MIQLCEETIRLGSVRIAEACESMAFSRASYHRSKSNLGRQVYWLLRGMEVQSCWLPSEFKRTLGFACRRHFDALCEQSAINLVSILAANAHFVDELGENGDGAVLSAVSDARDVLEAILQDDAMASVLKGHVEANLLRYVVDIALEDAKGDSVMVAKNIINCLEERCLTEGDNGGIVTTLANPKMYLDLLHIAAAILYQEEKSLGPMEFAKCAFTVHGMHILMARMTQVLSWEGVICSRDSFSKQPSVEREEYFGAMRLSLCKGLMRVFVSAKPSVPAAGHKYESAKKSCNDGLSLEEEVEMMLSPCI